MTPPLRTVLVSALLGLLLAAGDADARDRRTRSVPGRDVERERIDGQSAEGTRPRWPRTDDRGEAGDSLAPVSWVGSTLAMPGSQTEVTYAEAGGPFAVVGFQQFGQQSQPIVYDLRTGEEAGRLDEPIPGGMLMLSPDGKTLVLHQTRPKKQVLVYSLTDGLQTTIPAESDRFELQTMSDDMVFATNKATAKYVVSGYELTTGKRKIIRAVPDVIAFKDAALRPDQRRLVLGEYKEKLAVIDLPSGKLSARLTLETPSSQITGLAYSPDGRTLAVMSSAYDLTAPKVDRESIALIDDETGRLIKEVSLLGQSTYRGPRPYAYKGQPLVWFPDGEHLLVNGLAVVSQSTGREVARLSGLKVERAPGRVRVNAQTRLPIPGGIVSPRPTGLVTNELVAFPLPLDAYAALAASFENGDLPSADREAFLQPGDEVGLVIDVASTQFDQNDEVAADLDAYFLELLEAVGMIVVDLDEKPAADDPLPVFRVSYQEGQGETMTEVRGVIDRRPTGRTLKGTAIGVMLEWTSADGETVYWQLPVDLDRSMLRIREMTDRGARNAGFEALLNDVTASQIPYYLHRDARPKAASTDPTQPARRTRSRRSSNSSDTAPAAAAPVLALPDSPVVPPA